MQVVLVLALLAGIATPAFAAGEKYGDTFVVGISSDPQTLNGAISGSYFDKIVASNVYSELVRLDYQMNPVPDLAEKWEVSPDGLTYTFTLKSGVKWHDGTPFTSADVKFTVDEAILKLHPRATTYASVIDSVETPDDNTVVFKLKRTFGPFINALAYDFFIIPKHIYENTDIKNNPANAAPIGTGPFKFEEWVRGDHVSLVRNPDYFQKGLPYLDRLVFKVMPDAAARVLALQTGEVDYLAYQSLPASAVPQLKNDPNIVVTNKGFESLGTIVMLTFNTEQPNLKDKRVRQAISMAIDRDYINEHADYGLGVPATSPFASTNWAYEPNVTKYPYDPQKAAALLDEAGYKPGPDGTRMTLRLTCDTAVELNRKTGEIIRDNLAQIGIKVDFEPVERGVMLDRVYVKRDFDMQVHGFSTGCDPAIDIARLYVSTNIRPVNFTNGSGYRNPAVDELFAKGESASDPAERAQYYKQVQKILTDDVPCAWLIEEGLEGAYNSRFHNVHSWSSYSYYIFWDVWSDSGKPAANPATTYIAIVAGVVVVAVVVWLVVRSRKRRSAEE